MYSCVTATLEQLKNAAKTVSLRYSIVVCLKKSVLITASKICLFIEKFRLLSNLVCLQIFVLFFISMDTTVRDLTRHLVYKSYFIFGLIDNLAMY